MAVSLQHQLDALGRQIDEARYDRLDPSLKRILASINVARPNAGDLHALRLVQQRLQLLDAGTRGFLPLPPGVLRGEVILGQDAISGVPVEVNHAQLARTTVVNGASGSGKTTLLHSIVSQALAQHIRVWTSDAKNDSQRLAVTNPDTVILDADTPLNLLQQPAFLTRAEHQAVFTSVFCKSFFLAEHGKQVVSTAFDTLGDHACLADLARIIEAGQSKTDTYAQRDATRGMLLRLHRIQQLYPALYGTRHGLRLDDLYQRSLYFPVKIQTEVDEFIFTYLLHLLFLHKRAQHQHDELTHLIHMDEGMLSWSRNATNKIEGVPLLSYLQAMVREFGIGMLVSTTSIHLLDPLLRSNSFIRISLNVTDYLEATEVARSFGMTQQQREYYDRGLTRGEEIIKLADGWTDPILATYPPRHEPKTVTLADWHAAKRRTLGLVPPAPTPVVLAAREESNGRPPTAHAPSASPPARVAPVVEKSSSNTRKVALNNHSAALMNDVWAHPFTLTTPCFIRAGLRLSEGDRAKTLLMNLGFLESHRVRTGAGRGKTGSALRLTPAGWQWLDRTPPKGTRGGDSVQHAFTVHELQRRIPRSTIETLGADLVIPYNTAEHVRLLHALETLSGRSITLNDGDVLALEVECSRPEITAPRNIARNDGFALTVIATLGKKKEVQTIAAHERVVIVDVLRFLDALRQEAS